MLKPVYQPFNDPRASAPFPSPQHSNLHQIVLAAWTSSRPSPATLQAREYTLAKVRNAVRTFPGNYELRLFGSVACGMDDDRSDLDVCVLVPFLPSFPLSSSFRKDLTDSASCGLIPLQDLSQPLGYNPQLDQEGKPKGIYSVYVLGDRLKRQGLVDVVCIAHASCPIVKCRDPDTGLELDVKCVVLLLLRCRPLSPSSFFVESG